jgi:hydroxymethylpyrimidine pyrophosphatase-like HAD family hydrolase/adenine/guanine phosphoribosyltransferase-like PRPP-binding protein
MYGELTLLAQPLDEWQKNEVKLNFFLLAGAVAQITSDYLIRGRYNFSKLLKRFKWLRWPASWIHKFNWLAVSLREIFLDRSTAQWLQAWQRLTVDAANFLKETNNTRQDVKQIERSLFNLSRRSLPRELRRRRLKLPSAFCSMDLTHYDYYALADKFAQSFSDRKEPLLVLGLRSAGSYLGPLVGSRLVTLGFENIAELTIRPKANALSRYEIKRLEKSAAERRRTLVIDDIPTSGGTLQSAVELLVKYGIEPERIVLCIPQQPEYELREKLRKERFLPDIARVELEVNEWWKMRWLHSQEAIMVVEQLANMQGWLGEVVSQTKDIDAYKGELDFYKRYGARLKKLFMLKGEDLSNSVYARLILAKSIGWGWFAYHAWLVAKEMGEEIPRVFGISKGIIFIEWIKEEAAHTDPIVQNGGFVNWIAEYISRRANSFPLPRNFLLEISDRDNNSWDYLAESLGRAYGKAVAKLAVPALRRRLIEQFREAPAAFIDAKLSQDKWIRCNGRLVKVDFEGHGIDNADLFMIDPAFDLAGIVFEFSLSPDNERVLLDRYAERTGDARISKRITTFKQLYGLRELYKTGERLSNPPSWFDPVKGNARFINARQFLVNSLLQYYSQFLPLPVKKAKRKILFMMDVDGVLDEYMYEYPATTLSGLQAIALLHYHDIPIALNTDRSLEDVKNYSKFLHLRGGVAEHGMVLWNAAKGAEKVLIDMETGEQLEEMRTVLGGDKSIFFSEGYAASLHCYCYKGGANRRGLDSERVYSIIEKEGFDRLQVIYRQSETMFVANNLDKGTGLSELKEFIEMPEVVVHAIGDSLGDLPMLRASEYAYIVANSSRELKDQTLRNKWRTLKHGSQRGLLEATYLVIGLSTGNTPPKIEFISRSMLDSDLLLRSARIADCSKIIRLLGLMNRDLLKLFQI